MDKSIDQGGFWWLSQISETFHNHDGLHINPRICICWLCKKWTMMNMTSRCMDDMLMVCPELDQHHAEALCLPSLFGPTNTLRLIRWNMVKRLHVHGFSSTLTWLWIPKKVVKKEQTCSCDDSWTFLWIVFLAGTYSLNLVSCKTLIATTLYQFISFQGGPNKYTANILKTFVVSFIRSFFPRSHVFLVPHILEQDVGRSSTFWWHLVLFQWKKIGPPGPPTRKAVWRFTKARQATPRRGEKHICCNTSWLVV